MALIYQRAWLASCSVAGWPACRGVAATPATSASSNSKQQQQLATPTGHKKVSCLLLPWLGVANGIDRLQLSVKIVPMSGSSASNAYQYLCLCLYLYQYLYLYLYLPLLLQPAGSHYMEFSDISSFGRADWLAYMQHEAFSRCCDVPRRLIFCFLWRGHVCQKMFRFIFRQRLRQGQGQPATVKYFCYHCNLSRQSRLGGLFGLQLQLQLWLRRDPPSESNCISCVRSVRTCCWCRRRDDVADNRAAMLAEMESSPGDGQPNGRGFGEGGPLCPLTSTSTNHKIMRSSSFDTFSRHFPSYAKNNCENQFRLSDESWVTSQSDKSAAQGKK